MSKNQKSKRFPDAPAGYRWSINDQEKYVDVQLRRGDHKKRPVVDAFFVLKLDRDQETIDSMIVYWMKEVLRGRAK